MVVKSAIRQWRENAPWTDDAQVEQDLIISRALVAIFGDGFLASQLAFRGGTALHKLYLAPQARYSEDIDLVQLRLKIEINCYEHFSEMGLAKLPFSMENQWFSGSCDITTYPLAELLGTKLRALYQRKKGRDLLDLYLALTRTDVDPDDVVRCYRRYMGFVVRQPPTYRQFTLNMEEKMQDRDFLSDSKLLLRPGVEFDPCEAYGIVKARLIDRLRK